MSESIPYGRQDIQNEDIEAVVATLRSDFLTQGPKVQEFENDFAKYVGSKYAVAVSNGTAALHLSVLAVGLKPGKKVITTPITFAASANCVLYAGGEVEFADVQADNTCLDPNLVEDKIKKNPGQYQGIIPVDYAGYPVNLDDFRTIANRYGLWLIEDACHAPGAEFYDQKGVKQRSGNGVYSDLSIFSFHPVKHIACGEGGMITTNNQALFEKLLMLRSHGITKDHSKLKIKNLPAWYHEMQILGYNYRMPDMLCALGISQLKRAEAGLQRRQSIAKKYQTQLADLPLTLPKPVERGTHAYHLYPIQTQLRDELYEFMKTQNIFPQVHYLPVYEHPYYRERYGNQKLQNSDQFYRQCLSIPMYPTMTDSEQDWVIQVILDFFVGKK